MKTFILLLCAWSISLSISAEQENILQDNKKWTGAPAEITSDVGLEKIQGFKGRCDYLGRGAPIVSIDRDRTFMITMDYSLAYKFWVLVGEPVFDMSFNHKIHEVRIISGTDDITLNRDIIPADIFDKIQVYNFNVELVRDNTGLHPDVTFYRAYPGVVNAQDKGSFDVPTSPSWDELFYSSSHNAFYFGDREFLSEKAAKSTWLRFSKAMLSGGNFTECYLRDIKVDVSAAMSWLHTNDNAAYKSIVKGGKYDGMVRVFSEKIDSSELSLKEKMAVADQAIDYLKSAQAPSEFEERIRRAVENKVMTKIAPGLSKAIDETIYGETEEEKKQAHEIFMLIANKYQPYLPESVKNFNPITKKGRGIEFFTKGVETYTYSVKGADGKYHEKNKWSGIWTNDAAENVYVVAIGDAFFNQHGIYDDSNVKYGFVDQYGNWLIQPTYKDVTPFGSGHALVETSQGDYKCINIKEEVVFEIRSTDSKVRFYFGAGSLPFHDNLIKIKGNNGEIHDYFRKEYSFYLNTKGDVVDKMGNKVQSNNYSEWIIK